MLNYKWSHMYPHISKILPEIQIWECDKWLWGTRDVLHWFYLKITHNFVIAVSQMMCIFVG